MKTAWPMVPDSGKASIEATTGDQAIRWSSSVDYYSMPPNQIVDMVVDAPMTFVLDNFNSTKLENVVLSPGDPATKVHPFIAAGMVRKTMLGMVETVTDVEWSETKISHKYRTNSVSGPPCCCINGYGAECSVEKVSENQTRLVNKAYQDTKWCMPGSCCCLCLCWNAIGNSCLKKDVTALVKLWSARAAQKDTE